MKNTIHYRLFTLLFAGLATLISYPSMAERPYESSSPWAAEVETQSEDDRRPAVDEPAAPETPVTETETQTPGDVMTMPPAEPVQQQTPQATEAVAQSVRTLDFPRRGMTQDKVQNELGRPVEIVPAVGTPPISRWVYDDRVVYFEYSSVIHVVAK